jgi:hypothetical protein
MEKVVEKGEDGIEFLKEEGALIIENARRSMVRDASKYALDKKLNIIESFLNARSEASDSYIGDKEL